MTYIYVRPTVPRRPGWSTPRSARCAQVQRLGCLCPVRCFLYSGPRLGFREFQTSNTRASSCLSNSSLEKSDTQFHKPSIRARFSLSLSDSLTHTHTHTHPLDARLSQLQRTVRGRLVRCALKMKGWVAPRSDRSSSYV